MVRMTEHERREEDRRDAAESVEFLERLYRRGSGCFGVSRRSPEVKKELNRARRASKKY